MGRLLKICFILMLIAAIYPSPVLAQGSYISGTTGYDVSWPNCNSLLPNSADFGIVGVNGGKNFSKNPCFGQQASWFVIKNTPLSLYINTGYPGVNYGRKYTSPKKCRKTDKLCWAYNYGWNAAKYAFNYSSMSLASTDTWWLDVETGNSWTKDPLQNRQALVGMSDALRAIANATVVGFYSTPYQWHQITNDWHPSWKPPNWVATGSSSLSTAISYCSGKDFTTGETWLTQYIKTLDTNYAC